MKTWFKNKVNDFTMCWGLQKTIENLSVRQLLYDDGWKMEQDYLVYQFRKGSFEIWYCQDIKKYILTNESRDNHPIYIFKAIPAQTEIEMVLKFIKDFPLVIKYNFSKPPQYF